MNAEQRKLIEKLRDYEPDSAEGKALDALLADRDLIERQKADVIAMRDEFVQPFLNRAKTAEAERDALAAENQRLAERVRVLEGTVASSSTYHGTWRAVDAGCMTASTHETLYKMFNDATKGRFGCYECGYFDSRQAPLVAEALNRAALAPDRAPTP